MSSVGVATGHPDGEDRAMPHGGTLLDGSGLSVSGATNLPGISGYVEVAGYRSLVVAIKNHGATALTVTPTWEFFDGSVALGLTDAQSVPAGESRRLLFQNHGDILKKVAITGGGAGDTVDYHVVPSNLDPFSGGVRETLSMIQRTPAQSIPNNTGTLLEFGPTAGTTFYTNAGQDFAFDLTGAGDIAAVHLLVPGIFLVRTRVKFGAVAGNYNKELNLLVNSLEPNPPLIQTTTDTSFDTFATDLECSYLFCISPASVGAANNSLSVSVKQVSGGAVAIDATMFQIVRLGSVFP